jgi:hypothetical protein
MTTTMKRPAAPAADILAAAQGLWQFDREEPVADDGGRQVNDCFTFALQGDQVTLRLLTLRLGQWKSPDDFYRLAARWQGRMLQYRPPFGDWADLARFERGRFIDTGNGKRRLFRRIQPDAVVAFNRAILDKRPAHDYRLGPDGKPR